MNIIEKGIMEYTDEQYYKYGDKVKEFQKKLDFDLNDCKSVNEKVVRLDSLSKACDILINKSEKSKDKSIIVKVINVLKVLIIAIILYLTVIKISPEVISGTYNKTVLTDIGVNLAAFIVTAVIISSIAKVIIDILVILHEAKIINISLRKAVIESNYNLLISSNKDAFSMGDNDINSKDKKIV